MIGYLTLSPRCSMLMMCVPVDLLSSCMIGGTASTRLVQGLGTMLMQARPGWSLNHLSTLSLFHSSLAPMCTLPVMVGLILELQSVLRSFTESSWRIGLRCSLLKYFYWLELQRANRMLLSLPLHMGFPAGGVLCFTQYLI